MPEAAVRNLNESPEVEFCAFVPRELYDRFRQEMPFYGANKFFVAFAMEAFLDEVQQSPDLKDQVALGIRKALKRGPKE